MYERRRPERSVAYQVVQQNLETWLARRRADWWGLAQSGTRPAWRQGIFWCRGLGLEFPILLQKTVMQVGFVVCHAG